MNNLSFKAVNGQMTVDEAQGIVECFVAAIGNKDSVGDIIVPGAFDKSFKRRKPRVVWGHDWNQPIGKVLDIYEVGPRDSRLPGKMKQAGVGGVFAKVQFNLNSERGREAFSNVVFFGEEQEWSIGYKTLDAVWDPNAQANILRELELYEVSPVLHGANQLTATISIKAAQDPTEDVITSLRDSKWDTFDIAWAKKLKEEHPDIWSEGGNIKGNDQWEILTRIAAKGKATTDGELEALKLREAWIARHKGDFRLPGVVAQIKWLAVGTRGEDYMKNLIRDVIESRGEKSAWDVSENDDDEKAVVRPMEADERDLDERDPDEMDENELMAKFGEALRDFVRKEPEFMGYLADDENWVHEGQEHDEDDWWEHVPLMPRPKKAGCGCGGCAGKQDDTAEMEVKVGRVLSNRNRNRLADAMVLIKSVLDETEMVVKQHESVSFETEDPHALVVNLAPVTDYHGLAVSVKEDAITLTGELTEPAAEAVKTALLNLGYDIPKVLVDLGQQQKAAVALDSVGDDPIQSATDLRSAVLRYAKSADKEKAKEHILTSARDLGLKLLERDLAALEQELS